MSRIGYHCWSHRLPPTTNAPDIYRGAFVDSRLSLLWDLRWRSNSDQILQIKPPVWSGKLILGPDYGKHPQPKGKQRSPDIANKIIMVPFGKKWPVIVNITRLHDLASSGRNLVLRLVWVSIKVITSENWNRAPFWAKHILIPLSTSYIYIVIQ